MKIKKNKTDIIFSKVVRSASNWTCSSCGKISEPPFENGAMDNAHNVSRSVRYLRWHPYNTTCLCRACHMRMTKDPHEHVEFFKRLDSEQYQFCREMKNDNMVKVTKADEARIYRHYVKEEQRIHEMRCNGVTGKIPIITPEELE